VVPDQRCHHDRAPSRNVTSRMAALRPRGSTTTCYVSARRKGTAMATAPAEEIGVAVAEDARGVCIIKSVTCVRQCGGLARHN
jgi:hypothetical protein